MSFIKLSLGLAVVGTMLVACESSEPSSSFPKPSSPDDREASHGRLGDPAAGEGDRAGGAADFQSCATQTSTAEARPVYLVFMFDRSGSMTANGTPR